MKTMSVTRALAELKRLDDRIQTAIVQYEFISVTIGKGDKQKLHGQNNKSVPQAVAEFQSNRDKLQSMLNEREAIKAAIVKSNAVTQVTLGKRTLTVAEAIELKRSIKTKRELCSYVKSQIVSANTLVTIANEKLNAEIETNMTAIYGADKGKVDPSAYESVAKPKKEIKEAAILDPLKTSDWVKELEEEISLVESELDFTLSESNAKTEITF